MNLLTLIDLDHWEPDQVQPSLEWKTHHCRHRDLELRRYLLLCISIPISFLPDIVVQKGGPFVDSHNQACLRRTSARVRLSLDSQYYDLLEWWSEGKTR